VIRFKEVNRYLLNPAARLPATPNFNFVKNPVIVGLHLFGLVTDSIIQVLQFFWKNFQLYFGLNIFTFGALLSSAGNSEIWIGTRVILSTKKACVLHRKPFYLFGNLNN
jgi:hypothetical protein